FPYTTLFRSQVVCGWRILCQCRAARCGPRPDRVPFERILRLMTDTETAPPARSSSRKLLIGSGLAIVAIGIVAIVLPAEFGVDPLGTGKALGLTKLAEPEMNEEQIRGAKRTGVLTLSDAPLEREQWDDEWQVTLAPYEGIELKYTLNDGAAIDFE